MTPSNLHKQDTDLEIIAKLIPFLNNKTFIDIGAEKGEFTKFLSSYGLSGVFFEPLPKFETALKDIATNTKCTFLPFAVDHIDRTADFYVACDHGDNPIEHFSSLHPLNQDERITHKKATTVTCRSLNSLLQEGQISHQFGIVKIDTEGNDLNVLKGMHNIKAEVLMCEYFMPGIYAGWELGHPHGLIEEAQKLGFTHCIAIKRADEYEFVSFNTEFMDKQWGNLIFLNESIYQKIKPEMDIFLAKKETQCIQEVLSQTNALRKVVKELQTACEERSQLIANQQNKITDLEEKNQFLLNVGAKFTKIYQSIHRNKFLFQFIRTSYRSIKLIRTNFHNLKKIWNPHKIWSPHIGKLYHYESQPLIIPNRYYQTPKIKNPPVISIVTPSFNQAHFLGKTIASVINQDYPALEYIIQDGGSTDNSTEVIQRYQSSLKHWESNKDNGQSHAINLGFRHATGDIMAYLNSDDILSPGTLHYVANYFAQHPEVDVVYGHRVLIDEEGADIGRWVLPHHNSEVLTWADYIPQETLFWRLSIWEKVGGRIDESFRFAMDWDLLLRFKEAGAKFARLPRFLGMFRIHGQQKTSSQMSDIGLKEMKRLRYRCHGYHVSDKDISRHTRMYLIKSVLYHKLYKLGILKY